jgi:hypothetical protein
MKLQYSLLILSVNCSVHIPLLFEASGEPFVQGRVPSLFDSNTVRFRLDTMMSNTEMNPTTEYGLSLEGLVTSEDVDLVDGATRDTIVTFRESNFLVIPGIRSDSDMEAPMRSWIAIGPRSSLIQSYGSIDLIQSTSSSHSASLYLGASFDVFSEANCLPGTLFNISTIGFRGFVTGFVNTDHRVRPLGFNRESDSLIKLPSDNYAQMVSVIRENSDFVIEETIDTNMRFDSCDRIRNLMEPVIISLADTPPGSEDVRGRIRFEPMDFIRPLEDDTCELRIRDSYQDAIFIDIFMIKDMNIRFERDRISFCDTLL